MNQFATSAEAHEWAKSYGLNYTYRVVPVNGMFRVEWNYQEPAGC